MVGRKAFEPEAALDAAIRAFWQRGYSATSVNDLVAATGLSRGSIYATFGDKNDLFLACLSRYVELVGAPAREALRQPTGGVRERVLASFDVILERMADPGTPDGCLLAQTAAESGALEAGVQAAVQGLLDDQKAHMRASLTAGGDADPEQVESLATYLVTVAQAVAVMHRAGTPVHDLRRTVEHAVRVLDPITTVDRDGAPSVS